MSEICSGFLLSANNPEYIFGCSVLTRPPPKIGADFYLGGGGGGGLLINRNCPDQNGIECKWHRMQMASNWAMASGKWDRGNGIDTTKWAMASVVASI